MTIDEIKAECSRLNPTFKFFDDGKEYGMTVEFEGERYELTNEHHSLPEVDQSAQSYLYQQALEFARNGPRQPRSPQPKEIPTP